MGASFIIFYTPLFLPVIINTVNHDQTGLTKRNVLVTNFEQKIFSYLRFGSWLALIF